MSIFKKRGTRAEQIYNLILQHPGTTRKELLDKIQASIDLKATSHNKRPAAQVALTFVLDRIYERGGKIEKDNGLIRISELPEDYDR